MEGCRCFTAVEAERFFQRAALLVGRGSLIIEIVISSKYTRGFKFIVSITNVTVELAGLQ